jgi:hypothetical protein
LITISSLLPHEVLQQNHPFDMSECGELVLATEDLVRRAIFGGGVGVGGEGGTLRGLVGFERYLRAEAGAEESRALLMAI